MADEQNQATPQTFSLKWTKQRATYAWEMYY